MKVELVKTDELKPFDRNPKKHPESQLKLLRKSISEHGWTNPILATKDGMIVAGHARLEAAKQLNLAEVPVIYLDMPYERAIAYVVADNRLAELAETDTTLLLEILNELIEIPDFDIELTGFEMSEIDSLSLELNPQEAHEDDFDVDAALDVIEEPVTKLGDIILLGRHRLMCGDSTKKEDVDRLMAGVKADMVFTDPPWNVAIGLDSNPRHRQREGLINDKMSSSDFMTFVKSFAENMISNVTGDVYCVLGASEWPTLDTCLRGVGFHWSATIIWVKDQFVLGRAKYHRRYEPLWYGWPEKSKSTYCADRKQDDVWEFPRPRVSTEHPTMKPIELVSTAISNSSIKNNIVGDFFGGSGSTLIACEQLDRICYLCEIDCHYCDVIVERYINFKNNNGSDVFLINDNGEKIKWNEIKKERLLSAKTAV